MKFRTEYKVKEGAYRLDPERPVTLIGSCFSDNIGRRMRQSLWDARHNPCGSMYNPVSVMTLLGALALPQDSLRALLEQSIVMRGDIWVSWLFDSEFARLTERECMDACLEGLEELRRSLQESQALIVTLGTAYVHMLADSGATVANCHKFPAAMFRRRLLDVQDVTAACAEIINLARKVNPRLKMMFTVSPVRHLNDGLHGNNISKATLLLGVEELLRQAPDLDIEYFGAYEILMDDLRDYRYYAVDLLHPSEEAVDYIWKCFTSAYVADGGKSLLKEGESLLKRINHRPIVANSPESIIFADKSRQEAEEFKVLHPHMLSPISDKQQ